MAQHDYNLANQSGADFRADLNDALAAIVTVNSGATSPSTTFAHQLWVDTANSVLKIRNSANDAWITTGVSITADNTFDINGGTVNGITSFSFSTGSTVTSILDEDDLSSDSATALATQQSIKAYVDSQVATVDTLAEILLNGNSTGGTDISLSSSDITGTGNINITGTIQSSGTITGNLTGDVTGNASTATALETARTINGTSFDGTANISFDTDSVSEGSSNLYYTTARFDSAFTSKSTSDLSEGTNLYYTDTRFDTRLATKDTDDLTEGTNLYFTNARVESYLDAGTSTPTFASAVINSSLTGSAVLDDDTFATASATTVATSESIKAYVDSQVGSVDTLAEILLNGNTTGGTDIAFGDNDKAIFGTGSDLQIYHDSSSNHSIIAESGAGSLFIRGQSITMQNADGSKAYFGGNGDVATAYYGTSAKLATSSSGIDVTGTVTADGLTVTKASGDIATLEGTGTTTDVEANLVFNPVYDVNARIVSAREGASLKSILSLQTGEDNTGATKQRLKISGSGDISFYDDSGTTQGLFWDASTERLGIGTTSPDTSLHVGGQTLLTTNIFSASESTLRVRNGGNAGDIIDALRWGASGYESVLSVKNSGNVGIGTDSPNSKLESYVSGNFSTTYNDFSGDGLYIQTNGTVADGEYTAGISFSRTAANNARVAGIAGVQEGSDADKTGLAFFTHPSTATSIALQESLRISADGNVGIGTDSPSSLLHLNSSSGHAITSTFTGQETFKFEHGTSGFYVKQDNVFQIGLDHNHDTIFYDDSGIEYVRLDGSTSRVGIGTSSPSTTLHVADTSANITIQDSNSSGNTAAAKILFADSGTFGTIGTIGFAGNDDLKIENNHTGNILLSGGNVGIGRTPTSHILETAGEIKLTSLGANEGIDAFNTNSIQWGIKATSATTAGVAFEVANTERMRIDSSGNLLVGKTSTSFTVAGTQLAYDGAIVATRSANPIITLNRLSTDGEIQRFYKDGTQVGSIGTGGGDLIVGNGSVGIRFNDSISALVPRTTSDSGSDGAIDIGHSSARFQDIYATNGTIQTSDINEKQDIEDLSEAETRVALAAKGLLKKYRWKSAVADKGDDARIHFGIIAQDLENAFANEGLDAGDYGMFISSTWTDEATGEEKTRLGVRYNELLAFIIAAI